MIVFRAVQETDLPYLLQLSRYNLTGITSFPKDKQTLLRRLAFACQSFSQPLTFKNEAYYWFILIDLATDQPLGIAAIESLTGASLPFYSYKISHESRRSDYLDVTYQDELLTLTYDLSDCSELCTLFLDPAQRGCGYGHFLSRARFLFIAQFPQRFNQKIIAEMRGYASSTGDPPFWNAVGRHFFHMSFKRADQLTLSANKQIIKELMPAHSIYIQMLPKKIRSMIGRVHPATQAALQILEQEGFRYNDYIDIFDAGPTLEALTATISTVRQSELRKVQISHQAETGALYMVSNQSCAQFKTLLIQVTLEKNTNNIHLSPQQATVLGVESSEWVRCHPL